MTIARDLQRLVTVDDKYPLAAIHQLPGQQRSGQSLANDQTVGPHFSKVHLRHGPHL